MFKRMLAFVIAMCMMLDTSSLTTLATEIQTEVATVSEAEVAETQVEATEMTEEVEAATEESETESVMEAGEEIAVDSPKTFLTEEVMDTEEVETEVLMNTEEAVNTEVTETEETENLAEENKLVETIQPVTGEYPVLTMGETNEISLPACIDSEVQNVWYMFTVPENGLYDFDITSNISTALSYVELYTNVSADKYMDRGYAKGDYGQDLFSDYMQAGDTIYVKMYTQATVDVSLSLSISKMQEYEFVLQEDGSYLADTSEFLLTAKTEAGYGYLRSEVHFEEKDLNDYETEIGVRTIVKKVGAVAGDRQWEFRDSFEIHSVTGELIYEVEQGCEYNVCHVVRLDTNELAVLRESNTLPTKTTNEKYILHDLDITENKIVFDIERLEDIILRCTPTDGSRAAVKQTLAAGWTKIEWNSFTPEKEYYIEFLDTKMNRLSDMKITTPANSAEIEYSLDVSEDGELTVTANVSGLKRNASAHYLYCQYTDVFGIVRTVSTSTVLNETGSLDLGRVFSMSTSFSPILQENTTHDITLWMTFDGAEFVRTVKQVTMPSDKYSADDITFTVTPTETLGKAEYSILIDGLNDRVNAYICYKQQEDFSDTYASISCTVSQSGATGTITNLIPGATYEFILFVGATKIEITETIGTTDVQLVTVGAGEINAFDFIRTLKLDSTNELTEKCYLHMYYLNDEGDYEEFGDAVLLSADNGYQAEFKTASMGTLQSDTVYKIKWAVSKNSAYSAPVYTLYETIKTAKADISFVETKNYYNAQGYSIEANSECFKNFCNSVNLYLDYYIREQGTWDYQYLTSVTLRSSSGYKNTISISDLKAETTYELLFKIDDIVGSGIQELTTVTFTTKADTRAASITSIDVYSDAAKFNVSASGMDCVGYNSDYLVYIREKGTDDEWQLGGSEMIPYRYETSDNYLYVKDGEVDLKENTIYEYRAGFWSETGSASADSIIKVSTGEFTTVADASDITLGEITALPYDVKIPYTLSGMESVYDTCICFYVREKGTQEEWTREDYTRYDPNNTDTVGTVYAYMSQYYGTGLKENTSYEYQIGFGDTSNTPVDSLKHVVKGEFSTITDAAKIEVTSVETTIDDATVNYAISDMGEREAHSTVTIFVREKGTEVDWIKSAYFNHYSDTDSGKFKISGLNSGTTYEYRIGFSLAWDEEYDTVENMKKVVEGEFTVLTDTRVITVNSVTSYLNGARIYYTLSGMENMPSRYMHLFVRQKGTTGSWKRAINTYSMYGSDGEYHIETNYVDLALGTTYEYQLGFGSKTSTDVDSLQKVVTGEFTTLPEDTRKLEVATVTPYVNGAKIDYSLSGMESVSNCYILVYYREKGTQNTWTRGGYSQYDSNKEENVNYVWMREGTLEDNVTYEYQIGFGGTAWTAVGELAKAVSGEVTTLEDTRELTITSVEEYANGAKVYVSLTNRECAPSTAIYLFLREKGTNNTWKKGGELTFSETDPEPYTGCMDVKSYGYSDLAQNTTYEYQIGVAQKQSSPSVSTLKKVITGEFSTVPDERTIEVTAIEPGYNSVHIEYTLSKMESMVDGNTVYIYLYAREKGVDAEWTKIGYNAYRKGDSLSAALNIESRYYNDGKFVLKDNTAYEYTMGFSTSWNYVTINSLQNTVTGEFTTAEDLRSLTVTEFTPTYEGAKVVLAISNNNLNATVRVGNYYREKGTTEWKTFIHYVGEQESIDYTLWMSNDIKQGTEYEYILALLTTSNTIAPETIPDNARKVTGSFTTLSNDYNLEFSVDEDTLTYDEATVTVTAKDCTNDSSITADLTLCDKDGNPVQEQSVVLKSWEGYTKDVTFTNLSAETEYTITKAVFWAPGMSGDIGTKVYDYKFTTKEAVVPTAIVFEEEEVLLNVIEDTQQWEGINSKTLAASVEPAIAADEFVWSISEEDAKVISVKDGVVTAVGVGEATVTVASAYDESVKATCKVIVKKYAIGRTTETHDPLILGGVTSIELAKNDENNNTISGLSMYEINADGSCKEVEDYTVTIEKGGIVTWADGTLQAAGMGQTRVIFEANGVKAAICVNVTMEPVAFGITEISSDNENYPAIKNEGGSYILGYSSTGRIRYTAVGETSPVQVFKASDFDWSMSDETVASVDQNGNITPLKAGKTTLTVTQKTDGTKKAFEKPEVKVELDIREVPASGEEKAIYAIATKNCKKIGDVAFPEGWEGWSWKYPNTPLVTNGINTSAYNFEAVYIGENGYPSETNIQVYIGKITGLSIYEVDGNHKNVLELDARDSVKLSLEAIGEGTLNPKDYEIVVPTVKGLVITEEQNGECTVTAEKTGSYTLKPQVKVGGTVVATGSYKITVVAAKQADTITLALAPDTEGIAIKDNKIIFETGDAKKDFTLIATVKDRYGEELVTKLKWSTTDGTVVKVTADKKESNKAVVTVKGEGHAVITVTTNDKVKSQAKLSVEIQNHEPRVSTNKVTVNTAFDYTSSEGKKLASTAGLVEIVPVYGEEITSVKLLDKEGVNPEERLKIETCNTHTYLLSPVDEALEKGNYDCKIQVETNAGKTYQYPLKVTVVNKLASVKVKMNQTINLFYTSANASLTVTATNNAEVSNIAWKDASDGTKKGFYVFQSSDKKYIIMQQQDDICLENGKLQDANVAKGTLTIKLVGYKDTYTIKNFKVKYNYKKPSLQTISTSTVVSLDIGQKTNSFYLYNKTDKEYIAYAPDNNEFHHGFDEITCNNENVSFSTQYDSLSRYNSSRVDYTYNGEVGNKKVTFTLDSPYWREALQVVHTIKATAPKVHILNGTVTINTCNSNKAVAYATVCSDNGAKVSFSDIVVKASNAKAQRLLDEDLLSITTNSDGSIAISQNDAALMDKEIPAGSYTYKVTPYYISKQVGKEKALNTVSLTIKVINKSATAKISPSGTIDLAYGTNYSVYSKKNAVWIDPKFTNLGSGDAISKVNLTGEYSDYFTMGYTSGHYYLIVNRDSIGKLKAGQSYKLAVEYTMKSNAGETYTLTSNTFTIKPKQSKPKVTVTNNNQTLYAAADNVYRTYYITVPVDYVIESATGALDCNKDGIADIVVSGTAVTKTQWKLTVKIVDCDAVGASTSGKTYTIPVTIKVEGRDGITKDTTANIKVKVKR